MKKSSFLGYFIVALMVCSPLLANDILYFKNRRVIEAQNYYIDNGLIHITMTNGRQVYLRADTVDWETTEFIKQGNVVFHKLPYEVIEEEAAGEADVVKLTNTSLRDIRTRRYGRKVSLTVPGGRTWTDTGITLLRGQDILIKAQGNIRLWGMKDTSPSGIPLTEVPDESPVLPGRSFGGLIAKVGDRGRSFYCGSKKSTRSPGEGKLYLGPNDQSPEDNGGFWEVKVSIGKTRGIPGSSDQRGATGYSGSSSRIGRRSPAVQGQGQGGSAPGRSIIPDHMRRARTDH